MAAYQHLGIPNLYGSSQYESYPVWLMTGSTVSPENGLRRDNDAIRKMFDPCS
jgi:hypothetical protein